MKRNGHWTSTVGSSLFILMVLLTLAIQCFDVPKRYLFLPRSTHTLLLQLEIKVFRAR